MEDEGSYLPDCKKHLAITLHVLFGHVINAPVYHLGRYEPHLLLLKCSNVNLSYPRLALSCLLAHICIGMTQLRK